jgi:uncharacterized protein (DUF2336 family)
MADAAANDSPPAPPARSARDLLTRRLADIVCLPASQVGPAERWITADVLEELLRTAEPGLRRKVALRLAQQADAPAALLRRLACDDYEIAKPILERSDALTDFDRMEVARKGTVAHRLSLARREAVSETVTAALVAMSDEPVLMALLRNEGALLAPQTMDRLMQAAAENPELARLLIRRFELRPAQAFALFWDCGHMERKQILDRFAVGRAVLQDAAADVFPMAAQEDEPDETTGRVLAYIDRRQRDRAANDASVYGGLEGAVEAASRRGVTNALADEICRLAQIQPGLLERMLDDFGGEPLAVLTKATGMSRQHYHMLMGLPGRDTSPIAVEHGQLVFDTLSVDKAQTVLRYWEWSIRLSL